MSLDKLKEPVTLLTIANSVGLGALAVYVNRQLGEIQTEIAKLTTFNNNVRSVVNAQGEMGKVVNQHTEALNSQASNNEKLARRVRLLERELDQMRKELKEGGVNLSSPKRKHKSKKSSKPKTPVESSDESSSDSD